MRNPAGSASWNGKLKECKAESYLTRLGYLVLRADQSQGAFDLVAIHSSGSLVRLIQIAHDRCEGDHFGTSKDRDCLRLFSKLMKNCTVELWCWNAGKYLEIESFVNGEQVTVEPIKELELNSNELVLSSSTGSPAIVPRYNSTFFFMDFVGKQLEAGLL